MAQALKVKSFILALFSDKSGVSMMRVMSLICILAAVGVAFTGVLRISPDYLGLSELCGTFLAAGFAGKAYQKKIEVAPKESTQR